MKKNQLPKISLLLLSATSAGYIHAQEKPKPATEFTKNVNASFYQKLNFSDTTDFADARRGFIATVNVADTTANGKPLPLNDYDFIKGDAPASVNPALWRQAKLNMINGLFKVTEGVYQIRSFDIATMSIIETNSGYIVVDPLTNANAARVGLALVKKYVGDKPVVAVITTHSHGDHYGGIEAVASDSAIRTGKIQYIVPKGFYEESVSENVLLGNAMLRRAGYQFGSSLPKNEFGQVDVGLGKSMIAGGGGSALLKPSKEITSTGEVLTIDGLDIVFQLTPGTEAPAEMHFFVPRYKAFCAAENATHTLHNALPPRGAKVRDTKVWAGYIDEAIDLFGNDINVVFASHHWPIAGHERSLAFLEKQRDLYKYINDQTIHLANKGLNMDEIAEEIQLPEELGKEWYTQDFYGTIKHDSKATYQYYLGWYDGNPANYNKLPQVEAAKKYVEFMGGEKAVVKKAKESYNKGEYRWVAEVLKHVVFANPDNAEAKNLQADAFEQLGYQSESGIWRSLFLTGAKELREGVKKPQGGNLRSARFTTLTPEAIFDYLSIAIDGKKAAGKELYLRFIFPDQDKNILVYLKNGVLHQKSNKPNVKTSFTLTIPKPLFGNLLASPDQAAKILSSPGVKVEGDITKFKELASYFEPFDPYWNIVTP